jgi:type IV fimbrial biogenesis protein FimT
MVTIGVAAILMGAAIPSFLSWLPTLRLSSAARQIATDLQLARMKAISQNTKFRVTFVGSIPGATSYQLEKDNGGTFVTESGPFILPEGITVSAVSATSEFQPRGTTNATSNITLTNGSGQKLVCVKTVGRVNIAESSCT